LLPAETVAGNDEPRGLPSMELDEPPGSGSVK